MKTDPRPRVWLQRMLDPASLAELKHAVEVVKSDNPDDLTGCQAAIIGAAFVADADFMDRAGKHLAVISLGGIGTDNVDLTAATARGIVVTNNPDAPSVSAAELTVGLMLGTARHIGAQHQYMCAPDKLTKPPMGVELRSRLLGIVGLGRIGTRVAEIAVSGLGMRAIAYDPYVARDKGKEFGVRLVQTLDELLSASNVVSLHVPLTDETRHMINAGALDKMHGDAFLINTSRGAVIDERALIAHLEKGKLAGVGLDVFDPEPPTPDNPLLRCERVVATAHTGAYTDHAFAAMCDGAVKQALQVLRGERPENIVNPEVWSKRARR